MKLTPERVVETAKAVSAGTKGPSLIYNPVTGEFDESEGDNVDEFARTGFFA